MFLPSLKKRPKDSLRFTRDICSVRDKAEKQQENKWNSFELVDIEQTNNAHAVTLINRHKNTGRQTYSCAEENFFTDFSLLSLLRDDNTENICCMITTGQPDCNA